MVILRQHQAPGTFTLIAFLGHEAKVAAATIVTVTSFNVCNKTRRKGHDLAGLFPRILVLGMALGIREYTQLIAVSPGPNSVTESCRETYEKMFIRCDSCKEQSYNLQVSNLFSWSLCRMSFNLDLSVFLTVMLQFWGGRPKSHFLIAIAFNAPILKFYRVLLI